MKKLLFLITTFLIFLTSCSNEVLSGNMYFLNDNGQRDKEYVYNVVDSYDKYKVEKEKYLIQYNKIFFNKNTLIILEIYSSSSGNKYELTDLTKEQSTLYLNLKYIAGLSTAMAGLVYVVEVNAKNIEEVKLEISWNGLV